MFERYTPSARQTIFFARYEASSLGSAYVEPAHLLLALFREDRILRGKLTSRTMEEIRAQIKATMPGAVHGTSFADIPLSTDTKRALAFAMAEAELLNHKHIDSCHLALGLLRLKDSAAGEMLLRAGITLAGLRSEVGVNLAAQLPLTEIPALKFDAPSASSLVEPITSLRTLLFEAQNCLDNYTERFGAEPMKLLPWSRKEALGHLVDYAIVHHTWIARALTEPGVTAIGYPDDSWVSAQRYNGYPWRELVNSWLNLNNLMLHMWHRIPDSRVTTPCRIGAEPVVPLSILLEKYVRHCNDIMRQILA